MAQSAFTCHSCLRRSLIALLSKPLTNLSLNHRSPSFGPAITTFFRHYHRDAQKKQAEALEKRKTAKALRSSSSYTESPTVRELTASQKSNLKAELKYLTDPLKLADHIHHVLNHDDVDKALALVRLSGRHVINVVSWNHILDWHMRKGKTKAALEVYNEMKKRSTKPDSHTYLLLLRGLADYAHHPHSLGRALSLYHSMSLPGNLATPTIMHTNCVLKVCARANDMDSLWDIASRLPERGPHAADHWTFTTILNNIRLNALTGGIPSEETVQETAQRREDAIVQGRRLWEVVVKRWRAGDIKIDEELTCSMGRLLLIGSRPRDWDDVLSLLRQTMDLPRLVPKLGTAARQSIPVPRIRAPQTPTDMKNDSSELIDPHGDPRPGAEFDPQPAAADTSDLFAATTSADPSTPRIQATVKASQLRAYATPGRSTLSLVLEACLKMVAKRPASDYWDLLTDPVGRHALRPDLDNMHMRLRILRQSHSSTEAATLVRDELPAARIKPVKKTFAIAMAACTRDSRSPNAVDAANRVLDAAMQQIAEPGARTLRLYLDCVEACANVAETKHAEEFGSTTPRTDTAAALEGLRYTVRIQLRALNRLEPGTVALKSLLNFGEDPNERPEGRSRADWDEQVKRERNDAMDLMKRMIAMYDRVMGLCHGREEEMGLARADRQMCIERKRKLQAFVTRQHEKQVRRTIQSQKWRGVASYEGKAGWRAVNSGVSDEQRELERPRRLEEVVEGA